MNKKAQFFIISTVVMAIALTAVITLLTIPTELTTDDLRSQTRDIFELQELVSNFRIITNSMYKLWPLEQTMRTSFTIKNYKNYTISNNNVIVKVDVNDYAVSETFELRDDEGGLTAYFSTLDNETMIVNFKNSFNALQSKKFFLYYNKISDSLNTLRQEEKVIKVEETNTELSYKSPYYEAVFNKTSGVLKNLTITGSSDVSNGFYADITRKGDSYNQSNKLNAELNIISLTGNELVINISLPLNSSYVTQLYHLTPRMIVLEQRFEIDWLIEAGGSEDLQEFNLSYVINTTRESLAYKTYTNNSLNQPSEELFNPSNSHVLFTSETGIGVIHSQDSLTTYRTDPGLTTRVQLLNNTLPKGLVKQELIISPFYTNHTNTMGTCLNYNKNPLNSEETLSKTSFVNYLTQPVNKILKSSLNNLIFNTTHTRTNNPQVIIARNAQPSHTPFSIKTKTFNNYDLNTARIQDENGLLKPYSVETRNYHNASMINFFMCNNASEGVSETSFELMNLKGEEFTITINSRSETINDDLTLELYASNNELIKTETITPSTPGSVETNTYTINANNMSGVYELKLSGDDVQFKSITSLPLISINGKFIINNTSEEVLFFQTSDDFTLDTSGHSPVGIALNNTLKELINTTSPFTKSIQHNYTKKGDYYLTIKPGVTMVNTSLNIGCEEYYLTPDYEIEYVLLTPVQGVNHYYVNQSEADDTKNYQKSNITYSSDSKILTTSLMQWDFDNDEFTYNGSSNWFSSGDFYACVGDYGSCSEETTSFTFSKIITNSTLLKKALFTSSSIEPIISFYNDSNLIGIKLLNNEGDYYTFGINWMINGDEDDYYKTSFEQEGFLNSEEAFSSYEVKTNDWNYIGKNDSVNVLGLFFKNEDLKQGSAVLRISDDGVKVSMNEFGDKIIYLYIGDEWSDLERVRNSLNSEPEVWNKIIQYYYTFQGENVESSGYLIG